jgi:hypothetical protein
MSDRSCVAYDMISSQGPGEGTILDALREQAVVVVALPGFVVVGDAAQGEIVSVGGVCSGGLIQ